MDCFLGAAGLGNRTDSQYGGRERIFHAVWFHCSIEARALLVFILPDNAGGVKEIHHDKRV
jgi:hypothetical protein